MHYVIFDLEWNQPQVEEALVTKPLYLAGEIIEIGAVKLDSAFRPVDELRLYIRPAYYTKLHRRIASLTHIREEDLLKRGMPFPEAYAAFMDWCGQDFAFMTWSLSDMPMLVDNMQLHGLDMTDLPVCYDIQRIFGREIMRTSRRIALDTALEILGERGDDAHDALHDARNTAKVCARLDLEQYLEEYGAKVFADPPQPTVYESHRQALDDEALLRFTCPWCCAPARGERWLPMERGTYMSMAVCEEEDEFLLTLELFPGTHVRRLIYDLSDDLYEIWQDKLEATPV